MNDLFHFVRLHGLYENRFTNTSRLQQEVDKIMSLLFTDYDRYVVGSFPPDKISAFVDGILNTETFKFTKYEDFDVIP